MDMRRKRFPFFRICLATARVLVDVFEQGVAKLIIRLPGSAEPDDGKVSWQPAIEKQIKQSGYQLTGSQVSRSSKDKKESRLRLNGALDGIHFWKLFGKPLGVVNTFFTNPFVRVGSKIITLGLDEVRGHLIASKTIEVTQG